MLLIDFKQRHSLGSNKSLVSSAVLHVIHWEEVTSVDSLAAPRAAEGWGPHMPHGREQFCPTLCLLIPTHAVNPAVEGPGGPGAVPLLPLPTATPTGSFPCSRRDACGEELAAKKNLWTFWMDLIPRKELCKRLEPFTPIPSGASVPPPRVPAVCTVLPCSRVVVNEVKQQVNKQANEPEVRSQVLPAALAAL